jgi:hypothetical protein
VSRGRDGTQSCPKLDTPAAHPAIAAAPEPGVAELIRTLAGPMTAVHCGPGGGPYTVSSQVLHVHVR